MSITSCASLRVTLRRAAGSNLSTAKPQKSHFALHRFVIANWRYPGPPWSSTSFRSAHAPLCGRDTVAGSLPGIGSADVAISGDAFINLALLCGLSAHDGNGGFDA